MTSHDSQNALAIETRALVKRYGARRAVDGLDLRVPRGCFFGLLGPNGAGKTTTISVLTTLLPPSGGSVHLLGRDVVREARAVRRTLGLVFQESCLDGQLTAREHLELQARLYHVEDRSTRVNEMLELVGLSADAGRPVKGFSGGMKRRLEIARGLLHRPKLLFLDEPTLGLDVAARAQIWEHLRHLQASGQATLFLTTHSMEEADALCERVGILDQGQLVAEGTPSELKAALGGDVVHLVLEKQGEIEAALSGIHGVSHVALEAPKPGQGGRVDVRVTVSEGSRRLPALLEAAKTYGVIEVSLHRPTLEHVFLHHTGHSFEPDEEVAR